MTITETMEALMLVAFSISWYWSIAKMIRGRVAAGKSAIFVLMICAGYVLGLSGKLTLWSQTGVWTPLIYLYAWNLLVTLTDLGLVLHFQRGAMCGDDDRAPRSSIPASAH